MWSSTTIATKIVFFCGVVNWQVTINCSFYSQQLKVPCSYYSRLTTKFFLLILLEVMYGLKVNLITSRLSLWAYLVLSCLRRLVFIANRTRLVIAHSTISTPWTSTNILRLAVNIFSLWKYKILISIWLIILIILYFFFLSSKT